MTTKRRLGWRGRLPIGFINRFPRRFVLFGPRVVPVPDPINIEAKVNRAHQKDINRLMAQIRSLEAGIARRKRSLGKGPRVHRGSESPSKEKQ